MQFLKRFLQTWGIHDESQNLDRIHRDRAIITENTRIMKPPFVQKLKRLWKQSRRTKFKLQPSSFKTQTENYMAEAVFTVEFHPRSQS